MVHAVQFMAGVSFLVLGFSMLLRGAEWTAWMRALERRGPESAVVLGAVTLTIGAFIVAFHPVWQGFPLVLTVIGWLAVAEGALYLLFPAALPCVLRLYLKCPQAVMRIGGAVTVVLGLYFLYVSQSVAIVSPFYPGV